MRSMQERKEKKNMLRFQDQKSDGDDNDDDNDNPPLTGEAGLNTGK